MNAKAVILLVEHAKADRFLFLQAVKHAGFFNPVQMVGGGRQAISYFSGAFHFADRELFPVPTIVALDLNLPRTSGWEVLEWLHARRKFAGLLVMLLKSCLFTPDLEKAYRLGANSFLKGACHAEDLAELAKAFPNHFGPFVVDYHLR